MYVIIAPMQIKQGFKDRFVDAMIADARGSVNDEPGCLRFDIIQDAAEPNRIWLYEAYKDAAAFEEHKKTPHFLKWTEVVKDWREEGLQGAGGGAYSIWPPDEEWK